MSEVLSHKIAAVRWKMGVVNCARAVGLVAAVGAALLAGGMVADWFLELSWGVRAGVLALDLAVLGFGVAVWMIGPVVWGPDDEELALLVERGIPDFRTRLIASVQLGRPEALAAGVSTSLVRAMIAQTEAIAGPLNFASVVKSDRAWKALGAGALAVLLGVAAFAYTREISEDLLKRALLANVDVPRKTRIVCLTGDPIVPIGQPVTLEATAAGVIPGEGVVELAYASGRSLSFSLEAQAEDAKRFARTIENVQETFDYRIRLGDGRTRWHRVRAMARPTLLSVEFEQHFPAYIKRAPERKSPGDLSLLAGSQLQVRGKASKTLSKAGVRLVGLEKDAPLGVDAKDATKLTGSVAIPAKGLAGICFQLVDEYGIASLSQTVYPVEVIADKEPVLRILYPDRKDSLATQQARLLIGFEATDDYGIGRVAVLYKGEGEEPQRIELDLADQGDPRRVHRRYELNLGNLRPLRPEGTVLEYWLEVQDNNTITGPGTASSEHLRVKIVSDLEKRTDLMNRLNDQLGTIDHVTQDQEKLNQNLGRLIFEKSP